MKNKESTKLTITTDVRQSLKQLSRLEKKLDSIGEKLDLIIHKGKQVETVLRKIS